MLLLLKAEGATTYADLEERVTEVLPMYQVEMTLGDTEVDTEAGTEAVDTGEAAMEVDMEVVGMEEAWRTGRGIHMKGEDRADVRDVSGLL